MIDIKKLRELHEAATPGDWEFEPGSDYDVCGVGTGSRKLLDMHEKMTSLPDKQAISDAELVAAMRNALPELLDLAEELEDLKDNLKQWAG